MPAPPDPARDELRRQVVEEVAVALERHGPTATGWKADLVRQYENRGVGRSTLFRWIDEALKSGGAGNRLAKKMKARAEERAAASPDPVAEVVAEVVQALPPVVRLEDTAQLGGTIAVIDKLRAAVAAAEQVMEYARTEEGKVRMGKLLLAASENLRRCLETAQKLQSGMREVQHIDAFHANIIAMVERIAKRYPGAAEEILVELNRLAAGWGDG